QVAEPRSRPPLLQQARQGPRHPAGCHPLHTGQSDRGARRSDGFLLNRMDFVQPGLRGCGAGPYDGDRSMSAQHQLRLPAAFAASAAIHAAVLALVLRAATSGGLLVGPPEGPTKAELIRVSLVSKP